MIPRGLDHRFIFECNMAYRFFDKMDFYKVVYGGYSGELRLFAEMYNMGGEL